MSYGLPERGQLTMGAAAMYEMFLSLKAAGFARWEALYVVAVMTSTGTQASGPENAGG